MSDRRPRGSFFLYNQAVSPPLLRKKKIQLRGIAYWLDYTHPAFVKLDINRDITPEQMKEEFEIIRDKLYCNAVRLVGDSNEKILEAAKPALDLGLQVWVTNRLLDKTLDESQNTLVELSKSCEDLRKSFPNQIVLMVANEPSLDTRIVWGREWTENHEELEKFFKANPLGTKLDLRQPVAVLAKTVKKYFSGPVTIASGPWEQIDWEGFDYVGVNLYLNRWNKGRYKEEIREYKKIAKPLAITEFGSCTFKGASDYGGGGWRYASTHDVEYDEEEQSATIEKCVKDFREEGVFGYFLHCFVEPKPVEGEILEYKGIKFKNSAEGSFGVMNYLGKREPLRPKKAFDTFAELNRPFS